MAVEVETAANIKVMGRPLIVRHVDTRGEAETARAEAIRLIAVNKVAALLVDTDAAAAERVGRESLVYSVPLLVLGELGSPPGENVVVVGAGPAARGQALAQCAADEVKGGTIAVIVDGRNALYGALAAGFVRQSRAIGRATALELDYLNEEDLKERVSRVVKSQPSALLVAGTVRDCLRVRSDLRAANVNVPLWFGGEDGSATGLRSDDAAGADIYLATAFAVEKLSDKGRDFVRRYQEEFSEPPTLAAALAYDGTRLLFEAMSQANAVNGKRILEQLAKVEAFESVTGNLSFKDRQAVRPVFVVRVKGGEAKVVKTVIPNE